MKKRIEPFDKLVEVVNDCADDGIDCDECKVKEKCVRYWDTTICTSFEERRLGGFISALTKFRQQKREPTSI